MPKLLNYYAANKNRDINIIKYKLTIILITIFLLFSQLSGYANQNNNSFSLKNIGNITSPKDFAESVIKEIALIKDKTHKNKVQAMIAFIIYESGIKTKFPPDKYYHIGWLSLYVYTKNAQHFNFDDIFILFREAMKNNLDLFYCFSSVYFGEEIPLSYKINFKDMY